MFLGKPSARRPGNQSLRGEVFAVELDDDLGVVISHPEWSLTGYGGSMIQAEEILAGYAREPAETRVDEQPTSHAPAKESSCGALSSRSCVSRCGHLESDPEGLGLRVHATGMRNSQGAPQRRTPPPVLVQPLRGPWGQREHGSFGSLGVAAGGAGQATWAAQSGVMERGLSTLAIGMCSQGPGPGEQPRPGRCQSRNGNSRRAP